MHFDGLDRFVAYGRFLLLSGVLAGAGIALGSTSALADACTDLGNCQLFQGECWCEVPGGGVTAADVCGYPAGYIGAFYSLNGLGSADGCENPADPMSFGMPCPAVTGVADGDRARTIITGLGFTPRAGLCDAGSDCDADCATNPNSLDGAWGSSLLCWDNFARWSRDQAGFTRCTNAEPLTLCEEALAASETSLGTCSTDLSSAESQLADADGDGVVDSRDACTDSASGAEVDPRGCDPTQFCAGFDASVKDGRKACKKADWQNDEPTQTGNERDCTIQKNGKGVADDTCVPAVL
jgi:hypothetical protein